MPNLDELRREAEEAKERLRRDILELRDILRQIAQEGGQRGRGTAEESLRLAETHIHDAISQAENRFDSALAAVTGCNLCYDDFVTRRLDYDDFTHVDIDCAFQVEITKSDIYRISVWASEALQDFVDVAKSGNTLKMSLKPFHVSARPIVRVKLGMPQLHKIRLGGLSQGTVRGFATQDHLDMNLSGSSTLDVAVEAGTAKGEVSGASRLTGIMKVADSEFVLSGASRIVMAGTVQNLLLNSWGATKVEMGDFIANRAAIHMKGASEAMVNVTDRLDIDLTSGSKLTYTGNPTVNSMSVTGASTLNRKS